MSPTFRLPGGAAVNDDPRLEHEAHEMGRRAMALPYGLGARAAQGSASASAVGRFSAHRMQHEGPLGSALTLARAPRLTPVGGGARTVVAQCVDGLPGRLITDPISDESRRMIGYWGGWLADIADLASKGYVYDTVSLIYSVLGSTAASIPQRAEELVRFVQHHPEIMDILGLSAPVVAEVFGVPVWLVQLALSRGEASDLIGSVALSFVPQAVHDLVPTSLLAGLGQARGGGRS